jgi:signal transduction histidine kinase
VSIRLKTIIGIACIEALLLLLLVSMTLNYLRTTNYDALTKRASTTVTLFATTTKDAVLSYDLASLDAFVREVLKNPDLVYARVLGPDHNVVAQGGDPTVLARPFIADHSVETTTDGVFDTAAEIREGGQVYGQVEIGLDISSMNAIFVEAERRSELIAVLEMGLVALFSFLLGSYLTKQLKVLHSAAKTISDGGLDLHVPVKGHDEIADVAGAFNTMVDNLRETSASRDRFENDLKELNRSLEQRVLRRTEELRKKNSELEQATREIKEAHAKLLHSEKMASIGVLAAGVAHEINNPIAFIMSNLQSLKQYTQSYRSVIQAYEEGATLTSLEDREAQQEKIQKLYEEYDLEFINEDLDDLLSDSIEGAKRVRDIVKGLRAFSHIDTVSTRSQCDLNECIQTTLKVVNNELKYHCEIRTELNELPLIYCCPGQINQVLLNLFLNAGQAIKDKGCVTVRSAQKDNMLTIEVEDTGTGIAAEKIEKIFDPFYTTKPVGKGTGLGLAISYGIIHEHGGELNVTSEPGKGSCFTISLPLVTDQAVAE